MTTNIIEESRFNVMGHLENERRGYYGALRGLVKGAFCRLKTRVSQYFVEYVVDDGVDRVFVDVYFPTKCELPYIHALRAFVNEKTSECRSGRIVIDPDLGTVKVRMETSIAERPVTEGDVRSMESMAIGIADSLFKRIDKIAHGIYFSEAEIEREEKRIECMEKLSASGGRLTEEEIYELLGMKPNKDEDTGEGDPDDKLPDEGDVKAALDKAYQSAFGDEKSEDDESEDSSDDESFEDVFEDGGADG